MRTCPQRWRIREGRSPVTVAVDFFEQALISGPSHPQVSKQLGRFARICVETLGENGRALRWTRLRLAATPAGSREAACAAINVGILLLR